MAGYNVSIYRISEDPKSMTKSVTTANRIVMLTDIVFKLGRDPIDASLEIRQDPTTGTYQTLLRANYILVSGVSGNMTRYYYVKSVKGQPSGLIHYELHEDVLMTWATNLKALTVTLDRSETIFNGYLPDSEYSALGYRTIAAKMFPVGLTNDNCILITTG